MIQESVDVADIVSELNRTIHEPARLAILTVLSACDCADFVFLKAATGLTAGNLFIQIGRLEASSLVTIRKTTERRRTITTVSLTDGGRHELTNYWCAMERMRQAVRQGESASKKSPLKPPKQAAPQNV